MLRVFEAASSDYPIVRQLFEEYGRSLGINLAFQNFEHELATLPGLYAPPEGALILAWLNDRPVGCVAMRPLDDQTCEMKRLYVRPAARGTGAGRMLAERAISAARDAGYRAMRLDTLPTMLAARSLYADLGFREIPPYRVNPVEGTSFLELKL